MLTADLSTLPRPLEDNEFYRGYRERLQNKLQHKLAQISRTEKLLRTLPEAQRAAYQALLDEAIRHRDEIQSELQELERILSQNQG